MFTSNKLMMMLMTSIHVQKAEIHENDFSRNRIWWT